MKFTLVINQKVIVEKKYRIDIVDAALLNFIYDWTNSPYSRRMTEGAVLYVWITPKKVVEQLPILDMKPDTIYRRMKNLVKSEFLLAHPDNARDSQCWFAITSLVADMYFEKSKDQPNSTTEAAPAKTTTAPESESPRSETFVLTVPKSDPSEATIRPLGFSSKISEIEVKEPSDLNPGGVGFKSAYYNTIISNTIVDVVVNAQEKEDNDNNAFNEDLIAEKIDALIEAKLPTEPAHEPAPEIDELPVLDFIKVAGRNISRVGVENYLRNTHKGRRGQEWHMKHDGLDFEQILTLFLDHIDQQKFDQQSYIASRFGWFSNDFMPGGKRTLPRTASHQSAADSKGSYDYDV